MSPASVEGELRGLDPENGGSLEQLQHFMQFMLSQLRTSMNFELVEAYLGLFLKVLWESVRLTLEIVGGLSGVFLLTKE